VSLLVADLPPAMGDPPLLAQVWQNLLANAFKYTAATAAPKVGVDAFVEDGRQWYRVSDNGAGFDMGLAKHLFQPFRRLHPESEFAGTGVGLSIVRRIVRRHGGEIRARANVGVGAVFEFTIEDTGPQAGAAPTA
jgi:signal transduction histidine kinase